MAGAPLVLLAGMNCTEDLWAGCGLDDALTPPLTEGSIDDQVDQLLKRLPPVFVLGGLSLGGIVAMAIAVREPSRVAGLCLVSTNAKAPTPAQYASWRDWIARLDAGESARQLQATILDRLLSPETLTSRPELVERTLAMGADTGKAALRAQLRLQATRCDLRPGLREVETSTLVVSGASDLLCPPSFHTEIANGMRNARMVTLDGAHLLPMERPAAFGALVRSWRAELA